MGVIIHEFVTLWCFTVVDAMQDAEYKISSVKEMLHIYDGSGVTNMGQICNVP